MNIKEKSTEEEIATSANSYVFTAFTMMSLIFCLSMGLVCGGCFGIYGSVLSKLEDLDEYILTVRSNPKFEGKGEPNPDLKKEQPSIIDHNEEEEEGVHYNVFQQ